MNRLLSKRLKIVLVLLISIAIGVGLVIFSGQIADCIGNPTRYIKESTIQEKNNKKTVESVIGISKKEPTFVIYYFDKCPYCQGYGYALSEFLDRKSVEQKIYSVGYKKDSKTNNLFSKMNITTFPTIVKYVGGKETSRINLGTKYPPNTNWEELLNSDKKKIESFFQKDLQ